MNNIFELASKQGLRFTTTNGRLSVEDLWTISLTSLDVLAMSLKKSLDDTNVDSFITSANKSNRKMELQFEIAKRVIEVRLEILEKAKSAASRKVQRQRLLEIKADKQDANLKGKSMKSIDKMLADLEDEDED